VSLLDVLPTTLELCAIPVPEGVRGRSLVPVLEGRPDDLPAFRVFLESTLTGSIRKAVMDDRFKLTYDLYDESFTLFDLANDPGERYNIWARAAPEPRAAELQRELLDWTTHSLGLMNARYQEQLAKTGSEGAADVLDPVTRNHLRDLGYMN
jgi:arylsulfatase A-like enzyme